MRGTGLALASGKASYALGDMAFSSRIEVVAASDAAKPRPDGKEKPVSEQVRQLRIPEFAADVAGTSLRLDGAPIIVNDPAGLPAALASAHPATRPATSSATSPVDTTAPAVPPGKSTGIEAAILAAGDLKKLTALLDVLGGREPVPNYQGIFTVHQKLSLAGGRLDTTGQGVIEKFVVLDADHVKPSFTENAVRIEDAVSLDNPPGPDGQPGPGVLSIGKLNAGHGQQQGRLPQPDRRRARPFRASASSRTSWPT